MTRLVACLMLGLSSWGGLQAQTAADSVKQVISDFFSSMKKSDTAGMRACFHSSVHFEGTQDRPDAEPRVLQQSVQNFFTSVARVEPGLLDERIQFGAVLVDGPLASVWTPYEFYFNGRFSHCGVNSFQLVRVSGKWLIQYLIDTRRKDCSGH